MVDRELEKVFEIRRQEINDLDKSLITKVRF